MPTPDLKFCIPLPGSFNTIIYLKSGRIHLENPSFLYSGFFLKKLEF
jgi:hypothetical protein